MARPQEIDKKEILRNARELIVSDGIEGFSMRKLALKCDIAASTIYLHFENKLSIAIAITSMFWEEVFNNVKIDDCSDFCASIEMLYFTVLNNVAHFKINFLTMFASFDQKDKAIAKTEMSKYMRKILAIIDLQISKFSKDLNTELITLTNRDNLAIFIYNNLESMLMKQIYDYSFFDTILKKLLTNKF